MEENTKYYVVKRKALPEILLEVAKVNQMLENEDLTIAEATARVGISRSSYYKYKDDIYPLRDNIHGSALTFVMSMEDEPGLLSRASKIIAGYGVNILTIQQTMPVNGVSTLTMTLEFLPSSGDSSDMIAEIEKLQGVRYLKILARG